MGKTFFKRVFPSTFEAMTETLNAAVDTLLRRGWIDAKKEPCTRLCLEEALVNAIRHGNQCDGDRKVELEISETNDGYCSIHVHDEGAGFSPDAVPCPEQEQLGGRGICLMRHFMDKVKFNREKNCLEMSFRRANGAIGARKNDHHPAADAGL